jgi:hypothetical protein
MATDISVLAPVGSGFKAISSPSAGLILITVMVTASAKTSVAAGGDFSMTDLSAGLERTKWVWANPAIGNSAASAINGYKIDFIV